MSTKELKPFPKELLDQLIKEKLDLDPHDYELFGTTPEGDILPGNYEAQSGSFVTKDGKVYEYWVEWNAEIMVPDGSKGFYTLGEPSYFKENPYRGLYEGDPEYFPAKKRLEERLGKKE